MLRSKYTMITVDIPSTYRQMLSMRYIYGVVSHSDKLEGLVSCSKTCKYLWDGYGQWKNKLWMPHLKGWE